MYVKYTNIYLSQLACLFATLAIKVVAEGKQALSQILGEKYWYQMFI